MKTVYPRWRGEHLFDLVDNPTDPGLSPLARGTHISVINRDFRLRFIPAGAGNTPFGGTSRDHWPVYPRWRGEHAVLLLKDHLAPGLSPLARGTHPHFRRYESVFRFIPAGAGNTPRAHIFKFSESVYPRWRGEHFRDIRYREREIGLSPLARGTPTHVLRHTFASRFIPAGAGNTQPSFAPGASSAVYPRWRGEHNGAHIFN